MVAKRRLTRLAAHVVLVIVSLGVLVPVYWMAVSAVSPMSAIFSPTLHLFPTVFHWNNFVRAWTSQPFGLFFFNSLFTNFAIVFIQLITSCLAAYAFVFIPFPGSRAFFFITLLAMMVPLQATFIPIYLMLSQVHFINTYQGLIVPFIGSAFGIFLLRQGFVSVPKEVIAAARIDGASEFRILRSIVLPNTKPALITLALLNFVWHYNSLFWPLVATNSTNVRVLPVALSYFLSQEGGSNLQWNLMMAADLFTIIPVVLIFIFGQRFIVRGIASSAVKG